jgi:hypothetical protein
MRVSKLRIGGGTAIRRTSLTSGDTILTWMTLGGGRDVLTAARLPCGSCAPNCRLTPSSATSGI